MSSSTYSIFVPFHNLIISDDIGGEIRIEDVLFVSNEKIPRIRRRLGLPFRVSHYGFNRDNSRSNIFLSSDVYATLKYRGSEESVKQKAYEKIKEAVFLLASSQFFRLKRYNRILFGGPEFSKNITDEDFLFDNSQHHARHSAFTYTPFRPYIIDEQWYKFISDHFFSEIVKIINCKKKINPKWKRELKKAAVLSGQSFFAKNLWESFLYNWIAIETLLARRGEKASNVIVERLAYLFGWMTNENYDPWERIVKRLYELRCNFVHKGIFENIKIQDVLETDMLLGNLLNNLCSLTSKIGSKSDLIGLSERNKARKTLGYKQLKRPKVIRFKTANLEDEEIDKYKILSHWSM